MKLTAPLSRASVTARQLNLTLILTITVVFALQLGTLHLATGISLFVGGLTLLLVFHRHLSHWNLISLGVYPLLTIALVVVDGLSLKESGLSYFYPALYLHLLISRSFNLKVKLLLGFGILGLLFQLWQPLSISLADLDQSQILVFATTFVSLSSAFVLSVIYLHCLRAEREELYTHNTGLSNYLEQFNRSNILLLTTDSKGVVTFINEAAEKVFFPQGCSEITLPADFLNCIEQTLKTGSSCELEFTQSAITCRLYFRKGKVEDTVQISGEILESGGSVHPKHALETVSEQITSGLFIVDKTLEVVYANTAARNLLFAPDEQLVIGGNDGHWLNALSHRERERMRCEILPSIKQKGAWAGMVEFGHISGHRLKRMLHIQRTNHGVLYCLIIDHTTMSFAPGLVDELVLKELADEHRSGTAQSVAPKEPAPLQQKEPQIEEPQTDSPRVLVADDDEINREIAAFMLKRSGIHPDFAHNGKEAVEQDQKNAYDIIILDLNMPVMCGLEAARHLSARQGEKPILVATTANDLQGISTELEQAGFTEILPKPFKSEVVETILKTWEQRKALRRA